MYQDTLPSNIKSPTNVFLFTNISMLYLHKILMTEQRTVNDFFMQQYFEKSVSLEQYSFKRPLVRVIYIPRVVTLVQLEVFELELRRLSCEGFRFIPHYQNLSHFSNLIHYSDNIYEPGSNEYLGT